MKQFVVLCCVVFLSLTRSGSTSPAGNKVYVVRSNDKEGKSLFSIPLSATKIITPTTSTTNTTQTVRYVPLISILAQFLPMILARFATFTGVNKGISTARNSTVKETQGQVVEVLNHNGALDEDLETELTQCDKHHIGLWPDKSNTQRYYKCELDPRTPPSADCIKDMFFRTPKQYDVPLVKPCFLLSLLQCANGFKYNIRRKVCMPDIVYGSTN